MDVSDIKFVNDVDLKNGKVGKVALDRKNDTIVLRGYVQEYGDWLETWLEEGEEALQRVLFEMGPRQDIYPGSDETFLAKDIQVTGKVIGCAPIAVHNNQVFFNGTAIVQPSKSPYAPYMHPEALQLAIGDDWTVKPGDHVSEATLEKYLEEGRGREP